MVGSLKANSELPAGTDIPSIRSFTVEQRFSAAAALAHRIPQQRTPNYSPNSVRLSEVDCPKDNPTQSKHPYPRPGGPGRPELLTYPAPPTWNRLLNLTISGQLPIVRCGNVHTFLIAAPRGIPERRFSMIIVQPGDPTTTLAVASPTHALTTVHAISSIVRMRSTYRQPLSPPEKKSSEFASVPVDIITRACAPAITY
jgi:hypothetical protein